MCASGTAAADFVNAYGEIHAGAAAGRGMGGDRKDDAFHDGATGGTYGAKAGVEVFFVDVWVGHEQYRDADEFTGTWTEFMLGFDVEMGVGSKKGGVKTEQGEHLGGYPSRYFELGAGVGYAVGTGQQVDPPLDASELTDQGFLAQAFIGYGMHITKRWTLGLSVPVRAAYMTKKGADATANTLDNHYTELSAAALLALRFTVF